MQGRCRMRSRRWPTLPRSLERSTIGAVGLNDRVRNGNGCGPYALTASKVRIGFQCGRSPGVSLSELACGRGAAGREVRSRLRVNRLRAAMLDSGSVVDVIGESLGS